jgi:hypothetical protein
MIPLRICYRTLQDAPPLPHSHRYSFTKTAYRIFISSVSMILFVSAFPLLSSCCGAIQTQSSISHLPNCDSSGNALLAAAMRAIVRCIVAGFAVCFRASG